MHPYTYTPLAPQHIRLLTLYPGHLGDLIEISVNHVSFTDDDQPQYEALSYCWGSEHDPQTISIRPVHSSLKPGQNAVASQPPEDSVAVRQPSNSKGGESSSHPESVSHYTTTSSFNVSSNLHSALVHLRLRSKARVLWIDAICINQADNKEKSIQVRKMGSIYRKAQRVVVWLGPASDHTQRAVDTLDHLGRQVFWDLDESTIHQARDCDPECKEWYRHSHTLVFNTNIWSGIKDLLNRPWFTRVWVWQEIWLANQSTSVLFCGRAEISWVVFKNSIMCLALKQDNGSQPELSDTALGSYLGTVRRLVSIQGQQRTILDLLDDMRNHSFCYNPRDRLYALLDFAGDAQDVNIQPDYNKTVAQVYYDYCVGEVNRCRSGSGNLLFLVSCEIDSWQEGPTWVPNWGEHNRRGAIASNILSAHSGSCTGPCELIDESTLRVNAVRCGVVQSHSSTAPANLSIATILPLFKSWLSGISDNIILKRITAVLMDGLFCSRLGDGYPTFEAAWEFLDLCMVTSPAADPDQFTRPSLTWAFSILRNFISGRCLFKTTNDQWGLCPPCVQTGDLVYSIVGCSCLMLLRQDEQERFKVVGMCSLEGHANMEAILGSLPPGYHVEDCFSPWSFDMWFVNPDSGTKTRIDPRLGSGHPGWSRSMRGQNDRIIWKNIKPGEVTYFDPRHSDISFLRSRGVKIESIDIV